MQVVRFRAARTVGIPVVAFFDVGEDPGSKDASADKQSNEAYTSQRHGRIAVGVVIYDLLCIHDQE